MYVGGGESVLTDRYPTLYYSRRDRDILKVNDRFEYNFCSSSKVVGKPLSAITQPVLADDFSMLSKEKFSREYAFLNIDKATPQLVELVFGEKPGEEDICFVTVRVLFQSGLTKPVPFAPGHNDIVLLVDNDRSIVEANRDTAQLLGYGQDEIHEMGLKDITHGSMGSYLQLKWEKFIKRGEIRGEHLLKNKKGNIIVAECRAVANVRLGSHLIIFRTINQIRKNQNLKLEISPQKEVFDKALNGIVFIDEDFNLQYVNGTCLKMLGYQKRDMIGKPVKNFCKSETRLQHIKNILHANNEWQGNITAIDVKGAGVDLKVKVTPLTIDQEETLKWQGTLQDISKRLEVEESLAKSERRFNRLVQAAPDGILIVNHDGTIEYANPQISTMLGYSKDELVGQPVEFLVPKHRRDEHVGHRERYSKNPHKRSMGSNLELFAQHKDGSKLPVDIMLGPLEENGEKGTIAIIRDISKYRSTQKKLEKEKEFTELLHRLTIIANENTTLQEKLKQSIKEISQFMGWPVGHVYLPANDGSNEFYPSDIWYVEDEDKFESFKKMTMCTRFKPGVGMVGEVISSGDSKWYSNAHKNPGFVRRMPDIDLNIRACFGLPILVKNKVVGVLEFFSDEVFPSDTMLLKKMTTIGHQLGRAAERDESESLIKKNVKLFKQLFDHSPAGVIVLDKDERVMNVNNSFTQIFGYAHEELVGNKLDNLIIPEELEKKAFTFNQRTFKGESLSKETFRIHRDGTKIPVDIHTVPVKIDDSIEAIFGIYVDLTKVKKTENELRKSLEEKKFLLEEIHHRVKNNLAIITSLLELQINQSDNSIAIQQLRDSQSRIYSMAMVHEHLYQMESFSYLKLDVYIEKLVKKIRSTFSKPDKKIKLNLNTESVKVTLDQAISCGQLINELVTNSFKHAFSDAVEGSITISLKEKGERITLSISDSGPGIPDSILRNEQSSLGLKLVNALIKQLEGELEINQKNGTTFCLDFPQKL